MQTIERTQALVDEWQPEVTAGLEKGEKARASAQFHDKLGMIGLKAAIGGAIGLAVGMGVSGLLGYGTVGLWPGMAVFMGGLGVCTYSTMRRDNANMEYQFNYPSALHRKGLLDNQLLPRLAEARAALQKADAEEMKALTEGLQKTSGLLERPNSVTFGGTTLRKR